jgi:hypothetical protein
MNATSATPSASLSAVSKLSARRSWISGLTARRSTTTSMSCFLRASSFGGSSSSTTSPSMRARRKPWDFSSSSFATYSPLRPFTIGASTMIFVPAGSSSTLSTICETFCASSAIP